MAYHGREPLTRRGACLSCGRPVEWQRVARGGGSVGYVLHDKGGARHTCGRFLDGRVRPAGAPVDAGEPPAVETVDRTAPAPYSPRPKPAETVDPVRPPKPAEPEERTGKLDKGTESPYTLAEVLKLHPDRAAWERAEKLLRRPASRTMLFGPPGTGKTTLPHILAEAEGWTVVRDTLTEETSSTVLWGTWGISKDGSTTWQDGLVTAAWRLSHASPVVLVFDEITRASVDCMSALLLALDDESLASKLLPTGETVRPKRGNVRVVATSNDTPNMLSAALASRLPLQVALNYPAPALVAGLSSRVLQDLLLAKSREFDPRAVLECDKLLREGMSLPEAANLVWAEVAQPVLDAARLAGRTA